MRKLITFAMVLSAVALHGQVFPPSNGGGPTLPVSIANGGTGATTAANALVALFGNQSANTVYAGPASGSATTPSFRALVAADLPAAQTQWVSSSFKNGTATPLSNVTRVWDFTPIASITSTNISYSVNTADNTAHLYDIGIYSSSGTLLCHIGATAGTLFAPGTGAQTRPFLASCSLVGGTRYLISVTVNTQAAILDGGGNTLQAVGNGTPTANNATSGGALNGSITPAADAWTSTASVIPLFSLHN